MQLHLVSGFLGSGKTTAIAGAARLLLGQGQRVGVITNDQGKYLVDTAFFRLSDVPTVEVTGGCFCCHYDDLDAHLDVLITEAKPDVIFAEAVGSCVDVAATVIRPLQALRATPASLSVLVDARLLRRRLLDLPMPFNDDIVYIFDQQIAEAGLLVINKRDLLSPDVQGELEALVRTRFPGQVYRFQDARCEGDLVDWLACLNAGLAAAPEHALPIDRARHSAGEARLAWLNAAYTFTVPSGQERATMVEVLASIIGAMRAKGWPIGHLKFVLEGSESGAAKMSILSFEEEDWRAAVPDLAGEQVKVTVNARVQTGAVILREVLQQAVNSCVSALGIACSMGEVQAFTPGPSRPTHRISLGEVG